MIRIAGEGDASYIDELKQLTERLGISKLVIFEGGVYGKRKWELFPSSGSFYITYTQREFLVLWWQRHWLVVHL